MAENDIFSILYEVNGQKYVIGITHTKEPKIASLGVNTPRPLPKNMRDALVAMVKNVRKLDHEPVFIDFNSMKDRASMSLLENFSVTPMAMEDTPIRSSEEVLEKLKLKLERETQEA